MFFTFLILYKCYHIAQSITYVPKYEPNAKLVGIKARGRISRRWLQENKARQILRKQTVLHSDTYTYVCLSGGKKLQFFDKFSLLCFLVSNVLGFALCLITDKLISRIFIYSFNEYGYNGKITLFSQTITLQRKSDENMNKSILIAFRLGYTTLPRVWQ